MLEREIGEEMGFRFFVPISNSIPDGVVFCEFRSPHDQQSSLQCQLRSESDRIAAPKRIVANGQ